MSSSSGVERGSAASSSGIDGGYDHALGGKYERYRRMSSSTASSCQGIHAYSAGVHDPFKFDVGRDPNKHNAFGYGVHFCLGAALARMEVNSFFSELVPRLKSIELTGDPQHIATIFVGGLKHLPIRYSLR
jgi:hypothetical protein